MLCDLYQVNVTSQCPTQIDADISACWEGGSGYWDTGTTNGCNVRRPRSAEGLSPSINTGYKLRLVK